MSKLIPEQSIEEAAVSLLIPSNTTVDVLILGAGRGGMAMLEALKYYDWVNICAMIDTNPLAPGLKAAKQSGISVYTEHEPIIDQFRSGIIIDVTGDKTMPARLKTVLHEHPVDLISGKSAKLMYDLVSAHLSNQKTIRTQGTRLDLLDSMLEITMLLEQRPPLSEVAHKSFQGLYSHVRAIKGLAVVFDNDENTNVIGTIGVIKPSCDSAASQAIQTLCRDLGEHVRFKSLAKPLVLDPSASGPGFNVIVPVRRENDIVGALLFDVPGLLSHEQETALNMASVHLNMTVKALHQFQRLETMAIVDRLTRMFNRHYFDQKLTEEIHRIKRRESGTLTCAFIDIDNFKSINDSYGHQVGDQVLKQVAESISQCIRDYDICARYGGDEFIILLPSDSQEEHEYTEQMGLRLLKHISGIQIPGHSKLKVSASIGMATQSSETLSEEMLLNMADNALYQAKEAGKCCLRVYSDKQFHLTRDGFSRI